MPLEELGEFESEGFGGGGTWGVVGVAVFTGGGTEGSLFTVLVGGGGGRGDVLLERRRV